MALPWLGDPVHADSVWDVHPVPERPGAAGPDIEHAASVRVAPRPDLRPRGLRHPYHDADLPQLLCHRAHGAGRGRQDRWVGLFRHLSLYHAAALGPRLRGRGDLAVHLDLERILVWADHYKRAAYSPGHCGTAKSLGQPVYPVECPDGRRADRGSAYAAGLHLPRPLFPPRPDGRLAQGLAVGST